MAGGRKDAETDYAFNCFILEKELGVTITPDYPVSKFMVQLECLKKYYDEQKKAMKSSGKGSRSLIG